MLLFHALTSAQVGIGTTSPDDGAILDISSTDKGLLIPRITLTGLNDNTTITPITTGLLIFNSTAAGSGANAIDQGFHYWNGSVWVKLTTNADTPTDSNVYENNGTVTGFRTINLNNNIFGYLNNSTNNNYLYLSPAGLYSDEFFWASDVGHGFAVGTNEAFVVDQNRMATLTSSNNPVTATTGSLVIEHEQNNGSGVSSIVFPSASNRGSDYAYISYEDDGSTNGDTNENGLFTIGIANDGTGVSDTDRDNLNLVASGSVGIGNTGHNQQAALDMGQTNKGLLINRVNLTSTTSSAPIYGNQANMPESLLVYNTATTTGSNAVTPGFYYWRNNQWNPISSSSQNIYTADGSLTGTRTLNLNQQTLRFDNGANRYLNLIGASTTNNDDPFLFTTGNAYRFDIDNNPVITMQSDRKVGIGIANPTTALHLYEATGTAPAISGASPVGTLLLEHGNGGGESSIVFKSTNNPNSDYAYIRYQEDYDGADRSAENGRLTIGIENDLSGTNVQDDINIKSTGVIDYTLGDNANATYTMSSSAFYPRANSARNLGRSGNRWGETWVGYFHYNGAANDSDIRLKENIRPLKNGLNIIEKLNSYEYNFKADLKKRERFGFIAQEVIKFLPEVVEIGEDPDKLMAINYIDLIPILVNAIQEQQNLIDSQKSKIENLETAVLAIQNQLGLQIDHSTQAGE